MKQQNQNIELLDKCNKISNELNKERNCEGFVCITVLKMYNIYFVIAKINFLIVYKSTMINM